MSLKQTSLPTRKYPTLKPSLRATTSVSILKSGVLIATRSPTVVASSVSLKTSVPPMVYSKYPTTVKTTTKASSTPSSTIQSLNPTLMFQNNGVSDDTAVQINYFYDAV